MKALAGMAVVALHAVAFAWLIHHCHGTELAVTAGLAPPALVDRVVIDDADGAPAGPGLHRTRWTVRYRGGFTRSVGEAHLVGPFQDGKACSGRVIVGQKLLAQLGGAIEKQLEAELAGESIVGAGDYRRVEGFAVHWAELQHHPDDADMIGKAPHGYVAIEATIVFDRVNVPIHLALVPEGPNKFRLEARAELAFDNRVAQWISNRLRGDKLATRLARRQLDGAIMTTLAPPPPFPIGDHQALQFTYCDQPPEIVEDAYGALPFAVAIGGGSVRPPRFGPGPVRVVPKETTLSLDLDLDALNAMLFELWRSGYLDRRLAEAGLDARFNADPTVQEFLSLRISPVRLALPPVISPGSRSESGSLQSRPGLRLSAETRVSLIDGGSSAPGGSAAGGQRGSIDQTSVIGRVWGGLDFRFDKGSLAVDLGALELSCERTPTTLVPCYADLVGAMRDRGADVHGALTTAFVKLLSEIFVDRSIAIAGMPGELVIRAATPGATLVPGNATVHLDLDAALH